MIGVVFGTRLRGVRGYDRYGIDHSVFGVLVPILHATPCIRRRTPISHSSAMFEDVAPTLCDYTRVQGGA